MPARSTADRRGSPSFRHIWPFLAAPSTWLLLSALVLTWLAKGFRLLRLHGRPVEHLPWAGAADAAVFLGIASVLALVERRFRFGPVFSVAVAAGIFILSAANALYLLVAGDQGSVTALSALWDRRSDVAAILRHGLPPYLLAGSAAAVGGLVAVHLLARRRAAQHGGDPLRRAAVAAVLALVAWAGAFLAPAPRHPDVRRLGRNILAILVRGVASLPRNTGSFAGYGDAPRISISGEDDAAKTAPNIVLVILESTRFDHTSLAGAGAKAATPTLADLSRRGFSVPVMRAVVPHTTKALWTMLCGRLPLLQRELWELSDDVRAPCLPQMLRKAGYRTALFQSAQGLFEQRARLADKLGYDHFQPWEDIRGYRLGYLASDDLSMLRPFEAWLDRTDATGKPFFVTFLTSSTHHPYRLPPWLQKKVAEENLPAETDAQRYARLVEGEDMFLAQVLDTLAYRSLRADTVVIALGDHGEGFGEHGVMQHDQNIYEEGVRVPFVAAGPKIPRRRPRGNASALDVLPTLLGLLDLPGLPAPTSFPGIDLSAQDVPPDRPSWLSCWFARRCRGFVLGNYKLIEEPDTGERYVFDLSKDPDETEPVEMPTSLEPVLERMEEVFATHRIEGRSIVHPEFRGYGLWWCPKDDDKCKHPRARHPDFRYPLDPPSRRTPGSASAAHPASRPAAAPARAGSSPSSVPPSADPPP